MKGKQLLHNTWDLIKRSGKGFSEDKVTKLSGALAYFTVFSFGPLLIIVIFLSGLFFGQEAAQGKVYDTLVGFLGADTASQLQKVITNAAISGKSTVAAVIGFVTLLIAATTVFAEIQDSINTIWGLKPKPKKGWLKMLKNRILSFSVIASLGFILVVSLAVTAIIDAFSKKLQQLFPDIAVIVFYIVNQLLTLCITTLIFGVVFKVLPDAKIRWKDVLAGALVTAVLFMLGKFAISFYISTTSVGSTYGAAGSLVVLLLWTYYSSIILYFGAEFTKAWSMKFGSPIHPTEYAVTMKQVEVETGKETVQEKERR